jgi:uncharacterized SAM-binding protein YcdF (DUF218 family)
MVLKVLECLLLPPASSLLLIVIGALLGRFWPRIGRAVLVLGVVWLWLASTPVVAGTLLRSLQSAEALPATGNLPKADAIVVLAAEADVKGSEYGGPVIGPMTMQRVRYAAALAKRTSLPVLVSGGRPDRDTAVSLAELMARALEQELTAPVRWREEKSENTWDNAVFSAELLRKEDKRTVLLVTSAWHMPRAQHCFEQQGIRVVPAPTAFRGDALEGPTSLLPHWQAIRDTSLALHEMLGAVYYRVRHG